MPEDNNIDLERCVIASIKQGTVRQKASSSEAGGHCLLAVQHLDGWAILMNAKFKEEVNGDVAFGSVKQQISHTLAETWHQRLVGKLLMGLVIGTAVIKQTVHCGSRPPSPQHEKSRILPHRVYLQDFILDPLLTEALHNPHLLLRLWAAYPSNVDDLGYLPADMDGALDHLPARSIINANGKSASIHIEHIDAKSTNTCIEHDDQEIIVVKQVIDKVKVAWLLVLLVLSSPAVGIVVGICSHNAEVGIAASAGVFALASFMQGLVAWI